MKRNRVGEGKSGSTENGYTKSKKKEKCGDTSRRNLIRRWSLKSKKWH